MESRTELAAEIGRTGLLEVATDRSRATLIFDVSRVPRSTIDEFVDAESKCCPFLAFEVGTANENVQLSIAAPEDGAPLARGLVAGFTEGWSLSR